MDVPVERTDSRQFKTPLITLINYNTCNTINKGQKEGSEIVFFFLHLATAYGQTGKATVGSTFHPPSILRAL